MANEIGSLLRATAQQGGSDANLGRGRIVSGLIRLGGPGVLSPLNLECMHEPSISSFQLRDYDLGSIGQSHPVTEQAGDLVDQLSAHNRPFLCVGVGL